MNNTLIGDIMSFKLMIKEHMDTELKYLCITKKEDYEQYLGSGVYWKNHLKKHGKNIRTTLLFESDDYSEFVNRCKHYSNYYDVVNSKEFANQIPEAGYDNSDEHNSICGCVLWWGVATDKQKKAVIDKRNKSIKLNHWSKSDNAEDISLLISSIKKEKVSKLSECDRLNMTENARLAKENWWNNITDEEKGVYLNKLKTSSNNRFSNMSTEEWEKLSERNRNNRLNMSEEGKQERKRKIQDVYATGKHDHLFEKMSLERCGAKNPNAKPIEIDGVRYETIASAGKILGMCTTKIYRRLNNKRYPNYIRLEKK